MGIPVHDIATGINLLNQSFINTIIGFKDGVIPGINNAVTQCTNIFNIVTHIATDIISGITEKAKENATNIISSISSIPTKLDEIKDAIITGMLNGFKALWIPSDGFFDTLYGGILDDIHVKFPIIEQINLIWLNMMSSFTVSGGDSPPEFNITAYGSTVSIIDFSMYDDYRIYIHGIIIAIAYYFFIKKVIVRIPKLIGGIS